MPLLLLSLQMLILIAFIAAGLITAAGAIIGSTAEAIPKSLRILFTSCIFITLFASIWSTYFYIYAPNENTSIHGWPVPTVIFRRDATDGQWKDYIGITLILALPMNWVLLSLPHSIAAITLFIRNKVKGPNK